MITTLIGLLAVAALYFGKRWRDSRVEITELRTQVAALKRQLAKHARHR
jgi:hypothetical protein